MSKPIILQLEMTVQYDAEEDELPELVANLMNFGKMAYAEGLLSAYLDAEVTGCEIQINRIPLAN